MAHKATFAQARDFDELYDVVNSAVGEISGIGDLFVYDVALRLGAYRGKLPSRVYLHSGTWMGAVNIGFDRRRGVLEVDELPEAMQTLSARELEDFLCLYKADLKRWYEGERFATIRTSNNCRTNGHRRQRC